MVGADEGDGGEVMAEQMVDEGGYWDQVKDLYDGK
jgi:hypothetical protein